MNTIPRINYKGHVALLDNHGCGRTGLQNDAMSFWQSRMTLAGQRAELPQLTDLRELAAKLREARYVIA